MHTAKHARLRAEDFIATWRSLDEHIQFQDAVEYAHDTQRRIVALLFDGKEAKGERARLLAALKGVLQSLDAIPTDAESGKRVSVDGCVACCNRKNHLFFFSPC